MQRHCVPEYIVALVVAAVYLLACCSVVVRQGLPAGPFDLAAIYGYQCVLTGWHYFPIGWLANPLIGAGVILLFYRRPAVATLCGLTAAIATIQWSLEWNRQGLWGWLSLGYNLWLASIAILVVGSFGVWIARQFLRCFIPKPKTSPVE